MSTAPSLAERIARALEAAGADRREVAYFWSFLMTHKGDDFRNDATVLARAGFGIETRGQRPFYQRHAKVFALLPEELQAILLEAAPEDHDGRPRSLAPQPRP